MGKFDPGGQSTTVWIFERAFEYLVRPYLAVYEGTGDRPGKAELGLFRSARRRGPEMSGRLEGVYLHSRDVFRLCV